MYHYRSLSFVSRRRVFVIRISVAFHPDCLYNNAQMEGRTSPTDRRGGDTLERVDVHRVADSLRVDATMVVS